MRIDAGIATILAIGVLAGCGGGGGGGGPGGGTGGVKPTPGTPVFVAGQTSQTGAITQAGSAEARTDHSVTLPFDPAGVPDGFRIRTPSGTDLGSWDGRQITCSGPHCVMKDDDFIDPKDDLGTLINPLDPQVGWSYQTFGYWLQDRVHHPVVFSTGSATPANAVLDLAEATYTGRSGGLYIVGDVVSEHRSTMTAIADFGSRTIDFSTTGTQMGPLGGAITTSAPDLNMQGTLSIAAGHTFSGTVSTTGGLDAAATGRFYGPNAEEIGGVYHCSTCPTGTSFAGAFGGKR